MADDGCGIMGVNQSHFAVCSRHDDANRQETLIIFRGTIGYVFLVRVHSELSHILFIRHLWPQNAKVGHVHECETERRALELILHGYGALFQFILIVWMWVLGR